MHRLALVLVCALALPSGTASARTPGEAIEAGSAITAVTVYRNRATVVREAQAALPAGASTVVFGPLPAAVEETGLRVAADPTVRIGAVELATVHTTGFSAEREEALEQAIQGLKDDLARLDDRKAAAELELEFLRGLARRGAGRDDTAPAVDPQAWRDAQRVLGEGSADALARQRAVAVERRRLEADLQKKQRELDAIRSGRKSHRRVRVRVEADRALATAAFTLSYGVDRAGWTPQYDARLDTGNGTLELVHKAAVRQNTGEAWDGVRLTLSTARPTTATHPPELRPWFIDFAQVRPMAREMKAPQAAADLAAGAAPEREAEVVGREFAAAWQVPGPSRVASDNQPRLYRLAAHPVDIALTARAVPRLNPRAYLFAEGDFAGDAVLPAGPATLYLDGTFRGRTQLPLLRPDAPLRLGFGVDDRMQVAFVDRGARKEQEGIFNRRKNHQRRYLFRVTNRHDRAMEVTLLDQLPVARHEAIEVTLLDGSAPPSERDVDDRAGVLAWVREVPAGGSAEVPFGYAVAYPADEHVPGFE